MSTTRLRPSVLLAVALTVGLVLAAADGGSGAAGRLHVDRLTLGEAQALSSGVTGESRVARASVSWCGTAGQGDQVPNVLAGNPAHWIYAVPSDGQDRLSSLASVMQSDAETIESWWRTQDGTHVPRADLAQFACGAQLDITSLRLPLSSAQLSPEGTRFQNVVAAVSGAGLGSRFTKYVVYYDGPAPSDVCGEGGGFSSGPGYAVVYVQACAAVSSAVVAVHELVHTYGAVPGGAPHMCPEPSAFHVCDDPHDLMYPFADGTPLSGLTLDAGHDDYYGHAGSWADIQESPWLVERDRQVPFTLSIAGNGTVDSDVPGLHCTQTCTTTWNADTTVLLTATPASGMKLVRWSGACAGSSVCQMQATPGASASALFAQLTYRLSVRVGGKGSIRVAGGRIACPKRCTAALSSYTPTRLTATAAKSWRFKTWQGACKGRKLSCTVPMSNDTSARAVFVRK